MLQYIYIEEITNHQFYCKFLWPLLSAWHVLSSLPSLEIEEKSNLPSQWPFQENQGLFFIYYGKTNWLPLTQVQIWCHIILVRLEQKEQIKPIILDIKFRSVL